MFGSTADVATSQSFRGRPLIQQKGEALVSTLVNE